MDAVLNSPDRGITIGTRRALCLIRWKGNSRATYPLETITEPISHGDFRFPHSLVNFDKEMPLYRPDSNGQLVETTPRVTDPFMETCTAALGTELNQFSYYS
jgi:hypothetical protein